MLAGSQEDSSIHGSADATVLPASTEGKDRYFTRGYRGVWCWMESDISPRVSHPMLSRL
jgi:hypothetical protein